jgi:hypothetical protein
VTTNTKWFIDTQNYDRWCYPVLESSLLKDVSEEPYEEIWDLFFLLRDFDIIKDFYVSEGEPSIWMKPDL